MSSPVQSPVTARVSADNLDLHPDHPEPPLGDPPAAAPWQRAFPLDATHASVACAVMAALAALAVLVVQPRFPDLPIARLHEGYAAMVPGTAWPVLALALAVLVAISPRVGPRLVGAHNPSMSLRAGGWLALVTALGVLAYGLWSLGYDILTRVSLVGAEDRVSLATALSLTLLSMGLMARLLSPTGRPSRRVTLPTTLVLTVALISLSGYAFDAPRLHEVLIFSGMSVLTALSVFALALSILLLGMHDNWLRHLIGPNTSARAARAALLPLMLGAFVLAAALLTAANRGYMTVNFSHALLADLLVVFGIISILLMAANHAAEERRTANSLTWLRNIIDATEVAAIVTDGHGKVILANRMAEDLAAASGGPAVWLDKTPFFVPGSMDLLLDGRHPRELARPSANSRGMQTSWMDSGGRLRSLRLYARTIPDAAFIGRQVTILTIIDETESWNARDNLAHVERLEAMGLMAGGAAHEFSNVLGVIQLTADVGLMKTDGLAHDQFEAVARACERGEQVTRRLLNLSRDSSPAMAVHDVAEILRAAPKLLVPVLPEKLKLVLQLPSEPLRAICDRAELEGALLNLTLNAVNALSERPYAPPEIVLSLTQEGSWLQIGMQDKGVGMDGETRTLATQPFFTTRGGKGGTGLGLSMVEAFARRSGGTLSIKSAPDEGTLVRLRLPVFEGAAHAQPDEVLSPAPDLTGVSILVVENDPQFRQTLPQALSLMGATVAVTDNAVSALSMAAKERYDLLLSDIRIEGGMNGLGLSSVIAEHFPHMARLLMTGFDDVPASMQSAEGDASADPVPLTGDGSGDVPIPTGGSGTLTPIRGGKIPLRVVEQRAVAPGLPADKVQKGGGVMILRKPVGYRVIGNAIRITLDTQKASRGAGRAK